MSLNCLPKRDGLIKVLRRGFQAIIQRAVYLHQRDPCAQHLRVDGAVLHPPFNVRRADLMPQRLGDRDLQLPGAEVTQNWVYLRYVDIGGTRHPTICDDNIRGYHRFTLRAHDTPILRG